MAEQSPGSTCQDRRQAPALERDPSVTYRVYTPVEAMQLATGDFSFDNSLRVTEQQPQLADRNDPVLPPSKLSAIEVAARSSFPPHVRG